MPLELQGLTRTLIHGVQEQQGIDIPMAMKGAGHVLIEEQVRDVSASMWGFLPATVLVVLSHVKLTW